jgi:hypothetical protein
MSDMKYNAIVGSGIPIDRRYDIPGKSAYLYPEHRHSLTVLQTTSFLRIRALRLMQRLPRAISLAENRSLRRISRRQSAVRGRKRSIDQLTIATIAFIQRG